MSEGVPTEHYDAQFFPAMFAAEDRHFWFRHRNAVIGRLLQPLWQQRGRAGGRILEVGCGTGNVLRVVDRVCAGALVVGMELFIEGLHFARRRTSARLVCGRIESLPFRCDFSLIGLFDVLEHIPDDAAALRALHAQLEHNGTLMLTVPAHQCLWSRFDEAAGHCRRYSGDGLRQVLTAAKFHVEYLSAFMLPLFPVVWLSRRVGDRTSTSDAVQRELDVPAVLNAGLRAVLKLEEPFVNGVVRLPLGTSLVAIARKV